MNAIQIAETLQENFIRYLLTTFNVGRSDTELAAELCRQFRAPGVLFSGPFLELNPPYTTGATLRQLSTEGLINESLCRLREDIEPPRDRPLPPDRPLYKHQEMAVRRVISEQRNIVVASGTGSGKTECFLIPVLNDLFSDTAPGVRALLIYPMNALVNDQLFRLRKLLRGTNITFGRYTSELEETEERGRTTSPNALENEIVSREVIRGSRNTAPHPPQILITNYAMLEYLMLRPEDSPVFDSGLWRLVCLDEAHTYTGAQGIEVSMLMRRLKHRLRKHRGEIRCIATSATLTQNDRHAAAEFASRLFGEGFDDEDVIFGETINLNSAQRVLDQPPPFAAYASEEIASLRHRLRESLLEEQAGNPSLVEEAAQALIVSGMVDGAGIEAARAEAPEGNVARFLWSALKSNPHLDQLRAMMGEKPVELRFAGQELFGGVEDDDERAKAVCHLVELGAKARESIDASPLLPARYHLFARSTQGVWLCLYSQCSGRLTGDKSWSRVYLEKRETCAECGSAVFELAVCRDCGQPFLKAFEREGVLQPEALYQNDATGQRYFTLQRLVMESVSDDNDEPLEPAEMSETETVEVCLICRHYRDGCVCESDARYATLYEVKDSKGNPRQTISTCPRCARSKPGEIVTSVRLSGPAPLAVLTEELYQFTPASADSGTRRKPGQGRKLLTFADSRQGAARYAAYLQETVNSTLYRHLIARAARELNESGMMPDLEELAGKCDELAEKYGLYGTLSGYATEAERRRKKANMCARIAAEFCARTDPRHSLSALGLVGCDVYFPTATIPDEALCARFGLAPEAMMTTIQAMLDTMRLDKVVSMPEGVRPDDDVFGRNKSTTRCRVTGAIGQYERNWVGQSSRQTRFDYAQRILRTVRRPSDTLDVKDALQSVWNWLQEERVFVGDSQAGFQINTTRLVFPADDEWYRCNGCLRLSRRLLEENFRLCPSRGCNGELKLCEPGAEFADDHYRYIFDRQPLGMHVEEHTAQLQPEVGREYQDGFIKGEINVLSCSTTFELGVDVGELQTVVLNNVPPSVANYRQRAGRAGRRAGGTAFILTYAAPRPHDRVYFADPPSIIAGEVAVPNLAVDNRVIAVRHLNATLLGHFLRYLSRKGRSDLSRIGAFFASNLPDGRHIDFIEQWRNEYSQEIEQLIHRFFEENPEVPANTPEDCINGLVKALSDCAEEFLLWLDEYERLRNHYTGKADNTNDRSDQQSAERMRKRFVALRQRLLDERMIDFLCSQGVLPSYSFPIDMVSLRLPSGRQYGDGKEADKSLRLERDKKIAIVEYAPGAEIVADKHIWKSVGLVIHRELNSYEYRVCETCRNLDRSPRGGLPISGACKVCGESSPGNGYRYVDPDGFTTDLTSDPRQAGLQIDFGVNRSRFFLLAEGPRIERQETRPVDGPPIIHYAYRRDGELVALNSGGDPDGFLLCETCGKKVDPPRRNKRKREKADHDTPWGEKCFGTTNRYHLGHAFMSDTLHLRFEDTANYALEPGSDTSFWRSLTYALLEGASLALQIERRDLDGVVRPFNIGATEIPHENYSQEVVLFDNVPGGAGHVRSIANHLEAVLRQALTIVQCSQCEEDTSCLNCLRNYGNQVYWEELKRGPVARFLESIIAEAFPENLAHLAEGASRVAAIDKTQWLIRQLMSAEQEIFIAAARITRNRPQGETGNWIEILQELLKRGRRVSLLLAELPPADRTRHEMLGLQNHLRLLVSDYGLQLSVLENPPLPDWHVVIDPQGLQCRVIRVEDADKTLSERTGAGGLITTTNQGAVQAVAARLRAVNRREIKSSELEPPSRFSIRHISEGERVTDAQIFSEVFQNPLMSVHINDRYLRSAKHEQRLRSILSLILAQPDLRPEVTITTLAAEVSPSRPPYFQSSHEQQRMFTRLALAFPELIIKAQIQHSLPDVPHDRFLLLTRADGTLARITIGAGLDFIQPDGRACMTDIFIEDPLS